MSERTTKRISDLGAGAYLMMHGYKPLGRENKAILFDVPVGEEKKVDELIMDYLCSEYHRFDSCLISLKKIGEISH